MSYRSTIAAFVCLLLAATSSFAQDPKDDAGKLFRQFVEDKARELSLKDTQERDLRELVGMILKVRICSVLELEEEKCIALMARVGGALDKLHGLKWERGAIKYYLKGLRDPKLEPSQEDLLQRYLRAKNLDFEIEGLSQKVASMSEGILTLEQQIGLYLFLDDFSNEMNRLVRKAQRVADMNRALKEEPKPSGDNHHKPEKAPSK
jgi:hypothetical protein